MRNKIILALIILIAAGKPVLAIQDAKVISDSKTKEQVNNVFTELNQPTDNFFTPKARHIVGEKKVEKGLNAQDTLINSNHRGAILPIPKFKLMVKNWGKPKTTEEVADTATKDQALLDCDNMEYFAPKTELEANGHVVMFFPQNASTIKADKVVYNQTSNLIKAFGNVVLISDGKELKGDYMQIDLNEENAVMDQPLTDVLQIRAKAKTGYMYGDKIIQEQGSAFITKKTAIKMRTDLYGPDMEYFYTAGTDKSFYAKENHGEKLRISTNEMVINSKKEHDTLKLKHAEIYFNDKKIGTIPQITLHTNKTQDYVQAAFPEFGTMMNLGMYAGPGFVFDTPGGSTLKLIPILNYQTNSDEGISKLGWGGIAKYYSATNMTSMAYGTSNEVFILRGKQKLDDTVYFQYGSNSYLDDWFMGFRMPRLMGELVYEDSFVNKDFAGKDFPMIFSHRVAAGYAQDGQTGNGKQPALGTDGIGTMRFKYMAEVAQTLWSWNIDPNDRMPKGPLNAMLEVVGQGSAALYGTGDSQLVARVGPRLHTQYKNWMQDVGYFYSKYSDHTPLINFDRYMYGQSNAYMRETIKLHKYLALSWFGSLNLSGDSWDGHMIQENSFFVSLGPDDIKLHIGYDTVRQQSFINLALNIDAKGATMDYKKMTVINPDRLGKDKNGNKVQNQVYSPPPAEIEDGQDRAEVIDIPTETL